MKFPWTKNTPSKSKRTLPKEQTRSVGEMYAGITNNSNIERMKKRWWWAVLQNPDNKVQTILQDSRFYSRLLTDRDPYMAKYRALLGVYIVGEDGLRLEPQLANYDKRSRTKVIANIKAQWKEWGKVADVSGRLAWPDIERLVIQNCARDGEVFIRFIVGKGINKFGFALEIKDPVLLDETYDAVANISGNRIIQGVELDKYNRAVAYWFWTSYMDERYPTKGRERERVPAEEMIHVYEPQNAQQCRGLPWTSNVILMFARFHEYMDATLQAAQMASNIPVIIKTTETRTVDYMEDATATNPVDGTGTNQGPAEANGQGSNSTFNGLAAALGIAPNLHGNPYANVNGLTFLELPPNKDAVIPQWNIPNQNFSLSCKVWLHSIATGLSVSYTSLTSDGGDENYSSGRLNSIVERDVWQYRTRWIIRNLHEKVYAKWIEVQCNLPKAPLQLPTSNPDDYQDVQFMDIGFAWVDPLNSSKAYIELRNMNWMSDSTIASLLGFNYVEELQKIADDEVRREALGVAPPVAATPLQLDSAVESGIPPAKAPPDNTLSTDDEVNPNGTQPETINEAAT